MCQSVLHNFYFIKLSKATKWQSVLCKSVDFCIFIKYNVGMKNKEILIQRPEYTKQLESWLGQDDLVKIITGVRRCGKSKLFTLFQDLLIKKYKVSKGQIININLEDAMQTREIGLEYNKQNFLIDYNKLLDFVLNKLDDKKKNYVFIDEIQLLENWQIAANSLRLKDNVDLYLTGSNAYMFSGDLANSFGGRHVEIKMLPFSFREYRDAFIERDLQVHPEKRQFVPSCNLYEAYERYIKESGFPQTVKLNDNNLIYNYLMDTVYLNTIQKDIISRYSIKDTNKLDSVIKYIFDNIGNETSLDNIVKGLAASKNPISAPTLDIYIKGMIDSYLIYKCDRYDIKGKKYLNSNAKYYVVDVGLRAALLGANDRDLGHILENIVYLELLRRGYRVSVGKVNSKVINNNGKKERKTIEVDFIAKKNNLTEYYQVALNALEPYILQRELSPLEEIKDNYPKFLLTLNPGDGENNGIKRLNVLKWLVDK